MTTKLNTNQSTHTQSGTDYNLATYLQNRHVVNVKDYGAVGDGVADDTAAIQSALNASGVKVVKLAQGETYLVSTGLTVPEGVILDMTGATIATTATITLLTLAGGGSGVVGKGGKLIGPSSSYVAGQKAIYATGTRNGVGVAPTYINVVIEDVEIDSFGDYAIELLYCSGKVIRPKITNCGYAGVFGYACKELDVIEPHVDTLVGETSSGQLNAYGVTFTGLTTATDTVRDPASTDCKVEGGYIANIPDWHGLDAHGGIRCKFIDNTIVDCRRGIVLTSRGSVNGSEDCVVKGNLVSNNLSGDNAVGNEKTAAAFWDIGNASAKSKRNFITGNKVYQHGGITTNIPAVYVENTEDGCIKGNLFIEPYTSCIKLFSGVARYDISNNTIVDPKGPGTGAGGVTDYPQYINITSASNVDITVHGNGLYRKRTSADTVVGQLGIVVANVASKTVDLRSNGFYGVVTQHSFGADRTGITGDVTDEFTGTLTGCTTSPTGTIKYTREGDTITLDLPDIIGTSNSTAATITGLPANCYPNDTAICAARITDNGTTSFGVISVTSGGVINLFVGAGLSAFTASGVKGVRSTTITYKI